MQGREEMENGCFPFTEALVSRRPIIVRRRVLWGECDPAGVVYTPRFSDYLVAAYLWFLRCELAGTDLTELGIGTPMKAMRLEFHQMLQADDWFDMHVRVGEVRARTFDLHIEGTGEDGHTRFAGILTPIMFDNKSRLGVAIPEVARATLLDYARSFEP